MTVTFTLSSLYTGATYVAGPFNIFAVTNTGSSTQVGTGITKAELATGHTISGISDATTGGTINSTGTCTNSYPWYVNTPEATPTPTATETGEVLTSMQAQGPYADCGNACSAYNSSPSYTTFYITEDNLNALTSLQGSMYTQNIASPSFEAGAGWYYHSSGYMFQIGLSGVAEAVMNQCNVDNSCGGGVIV
jgi:hypothetical protein